MIDRTGKTQRTGKTERTAKTERTGKTSRSVNTERSGSADRAGSADRTGRSVDDLPILLTLLRRLRGWSQAEMAQRSGVHKSSLSTFEKGTAQPSRAAVERLAAAAQVPMWVVDGALAPLVAVARRAAGGGRPMSPATSGATGAAAANPSDRIARALYLAEHQARRRSTGTAAAAAAAGRAGATRDARSAEAAAGQGQGQALVAGRLAQQFAGLIDAICSESAAATAGGDPERALALTRWARSLADQAPAALLPAGRLEGLEAVDGLDALDDASGSGRRDRAARTASARPRE